MNTLLLTETLSCHSACISVTVCACTCMMDGALSVCVLLPKSGRAVDQEDVGAAECPGAAGCWEEPGWSWSHIQGTETTVLTELNLN